MRSILTAIVASATESCPDPDGGEPLTNRQTVDLPDLLRTGAARGLPGKRLGGRHVDRDSFGDFRIVTTWKWSLRP